MFHNIAKNPEVQQKLYEECELVLGDDLSQRLTMAELNQLEYLEKVIKESLRLFPAVPFFARYMTEDVLLGGVEIPAGVNVIVSPFVLGRRPDIFPDPLKFDPSRFDLENTSKRENPYEYFPFSAGPRNCIGQKFAMLEIKSLTAKVVRNFELLVAEENKELVLKSDLVLGAEKGPMVQFRSRNRSTS